MGSGHARLYAAPDHAAGSAAPPAVERPAATGARRQPAGPLWQVLASIGKFRPSGGLSEPGDPHERHADTVAEQVIGGPARQSRRSGPLRLPPASNTPIQLKRPPTGTADRGLPGAVDGASPSGGQPLSEEVRAFMQPRFGHDFSQVRVHPEARAADAISARAFTHGAHIFFAPGEYQPATEAGRRLLAHELTHVLQQASGAGSGRIDRAKQQIGTAEVSIDYGDVVFHDLVTQYQGQIEGRYHALTGRPALDIRVAVAALRDAGRRWLMFALDLLADNPMPGLDLRQAVQRLIDYAPHASQQPLGPGAREFVVEAMRASGWLELALTKGLQPPSGGVQQALDRLYNPSAAGYGGSSSSACPAGRPASSQLDESTLRTELLPLMRSYLAGRAVAVRPPVVATHDVGQIRSVADLVQAEALRFFAPHIGRSHTRGFQQTWRYSGHLTPSTAPGAIPAGVKRAFLDNRARSNAGSTGLLDRVHYDPRCAADETAFASIIDDLAANASLQTDLTTILSWQTFTGSADDHAEVTMNLQYAGSTNACQARWRAVETLCHELMHVYVSQEFADLSRNRQLITEGFPEILGDQLYDEIWQAAMIDPGYRRRFEAGVAAGACPGAIPTSARGYGPASDAAEKIRVLVGNSRFRAAYFLGQTRLAGLQPKLRIAAVDDPLEHQADAVAARLPATAAPAGAGPIGRTGGGVLQRQPAQSSPQDRATVEHAKARLTVLEPLLTELSGRQLAVEADRLRVLAARQALDPSIPGSVIPLKQRMEEANWAALNLAPVSVAVTEKSVVIGVRFHVRFEDPAMKGRFAELQAGLRAGIALVWTKKLDGIFAGRPFTVAPEFTLVDAKAPRDHNFWLITVRKASTGIPVSYPGCTLDQPDPRIPTSVTDPMCDGGVMSIPPLHITNAGVLGHELLHLFGLIDRYLMASYPQPGTTPAVILVPERETGGRKDPLGGEDAPILREDLGYLFDKLGVYRRESERQTLGLSTVAIEVRRLRRIVELGYDPDSLVRTIPPKDFTDKVIKSAEDL